jgi:nucleoside-diphosphate-sugar epimerase
MIKKIVVCGAGGFIGNHLVSNLKKQGHYVIGIDLKLPEYNKTEADEFYIKDLRKQEDVALVITNGVDEIYQLAADMGGAGYIFTGNNDADIMHNSASINLNILHEMIIKGVKKIFYSSSACVYPEHNQTDPDNPVCTEDSAYPANPDSEYGWEKLFSERLYLSFARNYGIDVRIARLHNVYGPLGSYNNGKEKAPAAICRKIATANNEDFIEVWGPGNQTRSFLYIDECIEGINRLMASSYCYPVNLGSNRSISINDLVKLVARVPGKDINIKNVPGPVGVMGRISDNNLISNVLDWQPAEDLEIGISKTYNWIKDEVQKNNN